MDKWFAPTTDYARMRDNERVAAAKENHGDPVMFERVKGDEDTHFKHFALERFTEFGEAARRGEHGELRYLIDFLYPIWRDELVHTNENNRIQRSMFTDWLGRNVNHTHYDAIAAGNFFHELFEAAYQRTEEDVETIIQRGEALIDITKYLPHIHAQHLNDSFSTDDLRAVYKKSTNIYSGDNFVDMVDGLRAGFTVQELKKISPIFYTNKFKYTPTQLRKLTKKYSYATINNVLNVFKENVKTPPFDDFAAVLYSGFRTKVTVMVFAKNARLDKQDPKFFRTLATLRKKLQEDKALILSDKNANIVEVSEAIIQLYKDQKK